MKGAKLSNLIMLPCAAIVVALTAFIIKTDNYGIYSYILIFTSVLLTATFMLRPQVDWWWAIRHPPPMPEGMERPLSHIVPMYQRLAPVERQRFRDRVMLWLMAKEILVKKGKETEAAPEEVKLMMAAQGVMMTLGIEKYLLQPFERIILYPHPFPTPDHQVLHHSETNTEDGVAIFEMQRLVLGITQPLKYYNLFLHEWAAAFIHNHPDEEFPTFDPDGLAALAKARGMDGAYIQKYVGLENIDMRQAGIEHFFAVPARLREALPEAYAEYTRIFNLDPLKEGIAVLYINKIGDNPLKGE